MVQPSSDPLCSEALVVFLHGVNRVLHKIDLESRFRYDIVNLSRKEGVILSKIIYRNL